MELWMQIALGIVIGESILLILKSIVKVHNMFEGNCYTQKPERIIKEIKESNKRMQKVCFFSVVGVIFTIVMILFI